MNINRDFFRSPQFCLILMACIVPISFATWNTLLNNFVIEKANFTGKDIGLLQSVREIPGFLAFTAVFVLLVIKEQRFAYLSLLLLGFGTLLTGYMPTLSGLLFTTVIMSIGFHYFETIQTSLTLQWMSKEETPEFMGKLLSVKAMVSLVVYALIWLASAQLQLPYHVIYAFAGISSIGIALYCWQHFPIFPAKEPQNKHIVLRKRYWLYYALTFMSGARRQIFIVFAAFLMVEKFGFSVAYISVLYLINAAINTYIAPKIGRFIHRVGERKALIIEYVALFFIFTSYAFNDNPNVAVGLYILDHVFFAMAIAIKTYFQKIADPKDISSTAAVGFTINHIAAVFLPFLLGVLWLQSPEYVFLAGSAFAVISLLLSLLIPRNPEQGNESYFTNKLIKSTVTETTNIKQ